QEAWAILPRAAGRLELRDAPPAPPRRRVSAGAVAAALAAAVALAFGGFWWAAVVRGAYVTRPGEQKVATLDDGSRISLNTGRRVGRRVDADWRRGRRARGGEWVEVAPYAERPSVALDGDTRVRAIGTDFIVRRTADDVVVSLIKGRVAVS